MSRVLSWYCQLLMTRPIVTKSVTGATIAMSGDQMEQAMERLHSGKEMDIHRTLYMGLFGLCCGPLLHWWYGKLDRLYPTGTKFAVGRKMILDQAVYAPISTLGFFCFMGLLSGHDADQIHSKLKERYLQTLMVNYSIWPLAVCINFSFVPLHFQPLFANSVGLAYNVFLSRVQHS